MPMKNALSAYAQTVASLEKVDATDVEKEFALLVLAALRKRTRTKERFVRLAGLAYEFAETMRWRRPVRASEPSEAR